jgi:hypothetical protein
MASEPVISLLHELLDWVSEVVAATPDTAGADGSLARSVTG